MKQLINKRFMLMLLLLLMAALGAPTAFAAATDTAPRSSVGGTQIGTSAVSAPAAAITWNGTTSTDWNTASNWSTGAVPTASDAVTIPDVANDPVIGNGTTALATNVSVNNGAVLTVNSGGTLTINNSTTSGVRGILVNSGGTVTNEGTITIDNINGEGIRNNGTFNNQNGGVLNIGTLGGASNIAQDGIQNEKDFTNGAGSTITIKDVGLRGILVGGNSTRTVNNGTINIDDTGNDGFFMGSAAGFNLGGLLNTSSNPDQAFQLGADGFEVNIEGTMPGSSSGYGQVEALGLVDLAGKSLTLSGLYIPQPGDVFTIIDSRVLIPVSGIFSGLTEGATVTFNGIDLIISYIGGNDVTLTYSGGTAPETVATLSYGTLRISDVNGGTSDDTLTLTLVDNDTNLQINDPSNTIAGSGLGMVQVNANTVKVPLANITDGITIDTKSGTDTVNLNAALTLAGDLQVTTDVISGDAAIETTGAATIQLDASKSIGFSSTASLTSATGAITLNGNAAGTTTGNFTGLTINGATLQSTTGDITLNGTGGDTGGGRGIFILTDGTTITTGGNIQITANASVNTAIRIVNDVTVEATGSGTITIQGTSSGWNGIEIDGINPPTNGIKSDSGTIQITGNSTAAGADGIYMDRSGLVTSTSGNITLTGTASGDDGIQMAGGADITSTSGTITMDGTSTSSGDGRGILIAGSGIEVSTSADIQLTGQSTAPEGIYAGSSAIVNAGSGHLTLTTDKLTLASSNTLRGTGQLTIKPQTASTTIGIGGGTGTLNLTDAELNALQDGFSSITIGDATNGTGAITVDSATFNDPVTIASPATGGSITVDGQITGSGDASITLDGPGATTTLNADLVTAGNEVSISDSVVLGANASIDTTNGGAEAAGANVTISGTTDGANTLTINAGTGGDVTLTGAVGSSQALGGLTITNANNVTLPDVSLTANASLTQSDGMGTTSLTGDVTTSGTGAVSLSTQKNILLDNGSSMTTDSGNIILNANTAGTTTGNFRGIQIGYTSSASLQSTSGNIILNGTGGDTGGYGVYILVDGTTVTTGGNIQITASASADAGIRMVNDVTVEATGSGTLTIQATSNGGNGIEIDPVNGTTGGVKSDTGAIQITGNSTTGVGIRMDRSGKVSSNSGAITLTGSGGNDGIYMEEDALVTSTSGDIQLVGNASASGDDGIQIATRSDVTSTSGNITINGTTADANEGVQIGGSGVTVSTSGNVQITGQSNGGDGILINVSAAISTSGGGTIAMNSDSQILINNTAPTISTESGSLTMTTGTRLFIDSGTITTVGGAITLNANVSGTATGSTGIVVGNAAHAIIQSTSGNITLNGNGGTNAHGLLIGNSSGATVQSSTGDISLNGTGGTTNGYGIYVLTDGTTIKTGGDIQITGDASAKAGIRLVSALTVEATGSGTITIQGTSSVADGVQIDAVNNTSDGVKSDSGAIQITGTSTAAADGIEMARQGIVNSNSGPITLTGTGGGRGIHMTTNGQISSTSGPITLTTDNFNLESGSVSGAAALTIQPATASTTIGLGGGTGDLNLTDDEIGRLTDGFSSITIGDATNGTGEVNIDSATFTDPVTIAGGTIKDNSGTDIAAATNAVTLKGNVAPGQSPGILNVTGNLSLADNDTLTVEIGGTTAGEATNNHDQINVVGTVTIGNNVTLSASAVNSYVPANGDEIVIINNDSNDAVSGTFNGLAEGATVSVGGQDMTLSYAGGTDNNDVVLTLTATVIDLSFFAAEVTDSDPETVEVTWETAAEIDNAGFNLHRATSADGPYLQINDALIAASGQPDAGERYSFMDTPGTGTFFYKLEDVDIHGNSSWHGPVSVDISTPTAVSLSDLAQKDNSKPYGLFIGLALLGLVALRKVRRR